MQVKGELLFLLQKQGVQNNLELDNLEIGILKGKFLKKQLL